LIRFAKADKFKTEVACILKWLVCRQSIASCFCITVCSMLAYLLVAWWYNGQSIRLEWRNHRFVRLSAVSLSCHHSGWVIDARLPLSSSSIIWNWPKGRDAVQLGR